MKIELVLLGAWGAGVAAILFGAYLNFRSIRAGRGPSRSAIAIVALTGAIVLLGVAGVGLLLIAREGWWPASPLLLPLVIVAVVLVVGAVQGLRR